MSNPSEQLSKRDQLALEIMKSVVIANTGLRVSSYDMAEIAVRHADALFKALNK